MKPHMLSWAWGGKGKVKGRGSKGGLAAEEQGYLHPSIPFTAPCQAELDLGSHCLVLSHLTAAGEGHL